MVTGITRPPLLGRLSWSLSLHSSVEGEPVKTPGPALAGVSKLCGGVSQAVMSSQGKEGYALPQKRHSQEPWAGMFFSWDLGAAVPLSLGDLLCSR